MAQAGGIICATCPVADRAVCSALSPDDRAELARIGHHRRYTRGETIIAAGDPNTVCATLTRGAAKMSTIDRDGTERIVALVHPAGMLGQMFAPAATLHVTALTDSEACLFPRGQFAALRDARPALAARLLGELGRELDESRSLIDLISKRQARGRVAALILSFSRAASPAPCHDETAFELPLTRGEMAQLLGITIETVSRTLTAFEKERTIRREGSHGIVILDRDALDRAAS
ncbi:Crp/Fnr family transcriptional regulator [Sphingomonas koreensis]|uniref:Crp/Fnr family transcriptional regulator n=1 Tax=Sphingomonas koreensis TaxID=93064 RepID=UPI0008320FB5|nr:Crp/Fnr family transcriptional regulator [Sphingomonas koreensis]PJI88265.1 CRP/FNR family transcriptional regulator [Sphingomonas koreensis]RSU57644.1 Crp/Fnr family transcriptional regulator [Sphingomonas koreensis]RSU65759.1 Crp/Fnr family transcriptional regulator [Sphingomonas koreensis]